LIFVDRRKGGENNGNDFNVPEYLLPNQKDVLLTPLFTTNNKANVINNNHYSINNLCDVYPSMKNRIKYYLPRD